MDIHPWKYGNEFNVYNILHRLLLGLVAEWTKAQVTIKATEDFASSNLTALHIFILLLSHLIANYMIHLIHI